MKPLLIRTALRQTALINSNINQSSLLRIINTNHQKKFIQNESSRLTALKPMFKEQINNTNQDEKINSNPDSLIKNFKHLQDENKKRDPSMKPTLEQLLIVKEKLTNHVKA